MPRPADTIDDRTPLNAARIDVAARVGWFLRTHRTVAGLSLRQMAAAMGDHGCSVSPATLSRTEGEGLRSALVMDGYNRVLALPSGALRSGIAVLCGTFPYAPAARDPGPPVDLHAFSQTCEAVASDAATAGDWLDFADHHSGTTGFGLPVSPMMPLLAKLANELGRGVAHTRAIRHEALASLLSGPYGELTSQTLMAAVDDPHHQNPYDLTSALCERPTPQVLEWAAQHLMNPSQLHATGASYTLQGMLVGGGLTLEQWRVLLPQLGQAWRKFEDDPVRRAILAPVIRSLPAPLQSELNHDIDSPPGPPIPQVTWSRKHDNIHYSFATAIATNTCQRIDHPKEPLLERLLFEALFEPRGVRMSSASWLLMNSAFADSVTSTILSMLDRCPDQASRQTAVRVAAQCTRGFALPDVEPLLASGDPTDFRGATTIIGRSGGRLPDAALARGLAGDEDAVRQTLYCLGMAGDDRLPLIAVNQSLTEQARDAARWWLAEGSRILV